MRIPNVLLFFLGVCVSLWRYSACSNRGLCGVQSRTSRARIIGSIKVTFGKELCLKVGMDIAA